MAILGGAPLAGASAMGPDAVSAVSDVTALTGLSPEEHAARAAATKRAVAGMANRKDMTFAL